VGIKMKIHVAQFSSKLPGRKLSIANSMPKSVRMQTVKQIFPLLAAIIVPPWGLVSGYRSGKVSWAAYTRIYSEQLQKINLEATLGKLCALVGHDELVLCCWEGANVEKCHRKLLYDALPEDIRGIRE
jgi:uncharacterized protein YeaO (DUF488 family)